MNHEHAKADLHIIGRKMSLGVILPLALLSTPTEVEAHAKVQNLMLECASLFASEYTLAV